MDPVLAVLLTLIVNTLGHILLTWLRYHYGIAECNGGKKEE